MSEEKREKREDDGVEEKGFTMLCIMSPRSLARKSRTYVCRKGDIHVLMKENHKALEAYRTGLGLEPTNAACKEGATKVTNMINMGSRNMSEDEQKEVSEAGVNAEVAWELYRSESESESESESCCWQLQKESMHCRHRPSTCSDCKYKLRKAKSEKQSQYVLNTIAKTRTEQNRTEQNRTEQNRTLITPTAPLGVFANCGNPPHNFTIGAEGCPWNG